MARRRAKALADAALDDVLQLDHPQHAPAVGHHQRRPPLPGDGVDQILHCGGELAALFQHEGAHRIRRAFADGARRLASAGRKVHAAHARLRGEWHEGRRGRHQLTPAQVEALLGEHDDGAAFGRLVGQGGKLGGVGQLRLVTCRVRDERPWPCGCPG
jgi:hypothetical protein